MKKHFQMDDKTACGRKITYYPVDNHRPTLWLSSAWGAVDCSQCLKKKQMIEEITEGLVEMGMKMIALDMGMIPSTQIQINTGHIDAAHNLKCPPLDSDVK